MFRYKFSFFIAILLLTGCAQVPRDGEFDDVEQLVEKRIPQKIHWYQGGPEDAEVDQTLHGLIAEPLTVQAAVQIALLNNRRLQAEYEELGVAQADLVQAGLLSNPVFFASIRFPHDGGRSNTEFDLAKDFLDLLLRPARLRLAESEFEQAKLRVANAVLDLATSVTVAFYRVQGAAQLARMLGVINDSAQTSYELARRFDAAGNLSERTLAQERSAAAETYVEFARLRAESQAARDELNRLLGLVGAARNWTLAESLPELPAADPDPDAVETLAMAQHLDLAAARREITQLADALDITRSYRFIGGATVGVSSERDTDGTHVTGPNFSVELPLFDQRQAEIARLESIQKQSEARAAALETGIRAEVRAAFNRVAAARVLAVQYRTEVIPANEEVVKYTQQEQNYMLVDVFELLFARRQAAAAYRGYIEAVRDYWAARAELARAAGGSLPEAVPAAMPDSTPAESGSLRDMPDMQPMEHEQPDRPHEMQH